MAKNLKEHLIEAHTAMATQHTSMAQCHKAAMGGCEEGTAAHTFHKDMTNAHADAASFHIGAITSASGLSDVTTETSRGGSGDVSTGSNFDRKALTALSAAMMADSLTRRFDQLQETGAHKVLGDVPDSSLRLINRTGGAPIHTGDPTPDLDEALRKITA